MSFHEQVIGAHDFINRVQTDTDIRRGYTLLSEILQCFTSAPILPFDVQAIAVFQELRQQKIQVFTMDLRIAAIALSRDRVLLTRNLQDCRKVPALKIEDWTGD
ncbi:MAG: type II toxin-antitoxin system VapC family toxin [Planktothrix sp.]